MNLSNIDWKTYLAKIQRQSYLTIGALIFIFFCVCIGGIWYFFQQKEATNEAAKKTAEQELANNVKRINDYYASILNGASPQKATEVLIAIRQSSVPLSLSGFNLDTYSCDVTNCTFSYISEDNKIFNTQEINFFGKDYKANVSEKGLEYQVEPSPLNNEGFIKKYDVRENISVADCSELVNYVQSFNSLKYDSKKNIVLSGYPDSSISAIENILPEVKSKYGFKNVQWSITLSDDILGISSFLNRQAYSESFRINKIEKKKSSEIEVSGKLLCAI
ncbi:TPA: pilus assembly protein [Salmonella enterica]|nr:pilus assembly protein [Salmonella enterica]HBK1093734.1 pilus assembly protein [Salmonella enterica]